MSVGVEESQGTECERCGSLNFEPSGGLLYCLVCGTQSQDVREELTEENVEATSFVRTLKAPSTKKKDISSRPNREVTLLEKIQFILQVQCNSLITLGYEKSLKDAVKYLWFLYLKRFGYAFVDDSDATPTPSSPLVTAARSPAGSSQPWRKRTRTGDDPVPTSIPNSPLVATCSPAGPSQSQKRTRTDGNALPTPKRPKLAASRTKGLSSGKGKSISGSKGKSAAQFDEFPEDSCLFASSQNSTLEPEGEGERLESSTPNTEERISGNDLYLVRRAKRRQNVQFFSIKYTVGLLYLGLLYTHQKILPSDLNRLVSLNKVPYYNLHTYLPSHFITARHSTSLYARSQMTSEKIHHLSQDLYRTIPLPKLPPFDPKWVCHTLLERLQLPAPFYSMVDNALDGGVYWPECRQFVEHYIDTSKWREKRPDVECMGLILCIIKMIYRLDDSYEFEQASKGVCPDEPLSRPSSPSSASSSASDSELAASGHVYVWEDWVTVFCRHMQDTLEREIPLNARELEYVSDYQSFLDFCRVEVFPTIRPKDKPDNTGRRRAYRPEYYARVSEVFRQHLTNLQRGRDCSDEDCNVTTEGMTYSWDNFSPRLIPISALLHDVDNPPWKCYTATPTTSDDPKEDFRGLSNSMVLLLELCSDVVDSNAVVLMQALRGAEWKIIQDHLEKDKGGPSCDTAS